MDSKSFYTTSFRGKEDLLCVLNRLLRRVEFRSDSRVKSSLFFKSLYSQLISLHEWDEDKLEEELAKGKVKFRIFDHPYKITMTWEIEKIDT